MAAKSKSKTTKKVNKDVVKQRIKKVQTRAKKPLSGFIDFVREQGVVGLAIGFVLGAQSRELVDQLVNSFINPLLGLLLPGSGSLSERTFSLTLGAETEDFAYGAFLFQLITFIGVAAVIYFVFKGLKLDKLDKPKS